jgi:hypothetical protein
MKAHNNERDYPFFERDASENQISEEDISGIEDHLENLRIEVTKLRMTGNQQTNAFLTYERDYLENYNVNDHVTELSSDDADISTMPDVRCLTPATYSLAEPEATPEIFHPVVHHVENQDEDSTDIPLLPLTDANTARFDDVNLGDSEDSAKKAHLRARCEVLKNRRGLTRRLIQSTDYNITATRKEIGIKWSSCFKGLDFKKEEETVRLLKYAWMRQYTLSGGICNARFRIIEIPFSFPRPKSDISEYAMHTSMWMRDWDWFEYLVTEGTSVNQIGLSNDLILGKLAYQERPITAATGWNLRAIRTLAGAGAEPDSNGGTLSAIAAYAKDPPRVSKEVHQAYLYITQYLISKGWQTNPKVSTQDKVFIPLTMTAAWGNLAMLKCLLQKGAMVNCAMDFRYGPAFNAAIHYNQLAAGQLLADAGAHSIDARHTDGKVVSSYWIDGVEKKKSSKMSVESWRKWEALLKSMEEREGMSKSLF